MNDDERKKELLNMKKSGNEYYSKGEYLEAEKCYMRGLSILNNLLLKHAPKSDEYIELQQVEMALKSNMAQLKYKQENYYESIAYCDKVLKMDETNVKMFYRRAQANGKIWNLSEAERDYEKVIKLDSKMQNTVRKELDELKKRIRQIEQEEKEKLCERIKNQKM